jgi:hypothetical protein
MTWHARTVDHRWRPRETFAVPYQKLVIGTAGPAGGSTCIRSRDAARPARRVSASARVGTACAPLRCGCARLAALPRGRCGGRTPLRLPARRRRAPCRLLPRASAHTHPWRASWRLCLMTSRHPLLRWRCCARTTTSQACSWRPAPSCGAAQRARWSRCSARRSLCALCAKQRASRRPPLPQRLLCAVCAKTSWPHSGRRGTCVFRAKTGRGR